MSETIKKLNKSIEPYYALLTMVIFFSALFISAYKFIISPTDLNVTIKNESIEYPSSIGNNFEKILQYSTKKDTLTTEAISVYDFLVKTTDLKTVTLKNTGNSTLRGLKFKQLNSDALTAYGITGDFLTMAEEKALRDNILFDETRKIVFLKDPIDLPAKATVKIRLWGSFKPTLMSNDVVVSYDDGDPHMEESYEVSGLKGYLLNFALELLVIMILIFSIVYYVGITQLKKKYAKTTS